MTMISESGAIMDVNEIAAALGTTAEVIQAEDAAIASASLEQLLDDIENIVVHDYNDDTPIFQLAPAVESVMCVVNAIQDSGAISRSDAATLQQMTSSLEEFKGAFDCLPLSSYTELPSRVNFEASMESVLGSIGRKIVEIIKNIIKWIKEKAKVIKDMIIGNRAKAKKLEAAASKVSSELKKNEDTPTWKADLYLNEQLMEMFKDHLVVQDFTNGLRSIYEGMFEIANGKLIITDDYGMSIEASTFERFKKGVRLISKSVRGSDLSSTMGDGSKLVSLTDTHNCLSALLTSVNNRADNKINVSGLQPVKLVGRYIENGRIGRITDTDQFLRQREYINKSVGTAQAHADKYIQNSNWSQLDNGAQDRVQQTALCAQMLVKITELTDRLHGYYLNQYLEVTRVGATLASKEEKTA